MICRNEVLYAKRSEYKNTLRNGTNEYVTRKVRFHRDPDYGWMPGGNEWMARSVNRLWHRMVVEEARRRGL